MNDEAMLYPCCVFKCMRRAFQQWRDGRFYCKAHLMQAAEHRDLPIFDDPPASYEPEIL
ncbi:MAG: hypothetical protein HRJ53_09625 [Acidobacteria bacterium Pan2503]|uniref:Uncharacterized protein n=1 Tax=Candidatus Acidiferrum panamense TaxID=2741543 RepID=A0A7V8SWF4_9BACT|nr:hypothetical protein [Candidatus Acidoferrum panamensis]